MYTYVWVDGCLYGGGGENFFLKYDHVTYQIEQNYMKEFYTLLFTRVPCQLDVCINVATSVVTGSPSLSLSLRGPCKGLPRDVISWLPQGVVKPTSPPSQNLLTKSESHSYGLFTQ